MRLVDGECEKVEIGERTCEKMRMKKKAHRSSLSGIESNEPANELMMCYLAAG